MKKLLYIFIILTGFIACKSSKKAVAETKEQSAALPDSIYRFTVSFISKASGIDRKAQEQFDQFIKQFNEQNRVNVVPEITPWGREGERDYCLKLNELNSTQQEQFISQTKELLKNSDLIRYKENEICRYKRR